MGTILNFKPKVTCINCKSSYSQHDEDKDIYYLGHCPSCVVKEREKLIGLKLTTKKGDRINSLEYANLRAKKQKSATKRRIKNALKNGQSIKNRNYKISDWQENLEISVERQYN